MATFTVKEVEQATGARLLAPVTGGNRTFLQVYTDTRSLQKGGLFVALKGERFDGHDFVLQAVAKGAAGVVVAAREETFAALPVPVFAVPDTLRAYQALARFHRRRFALPVIAVTGSVGKTSTRQMIASVLSQKLRVWQTEKNFNNEIGLPKTLLGLTAEHEACVVEMGMRGPGQIAELAAIAEPTIGVVTNVGKSHIELLGSQENIAKAKGELPAALPATGTAVLNQDDWRVAAMAKLCRGKVIGYGTSVGAAVRAGEIQTDDKGLSFICRCFDQTFRATVPVLGKHHVYNALAAVATARLLGLSETQMCKGLAAYAGVPMREELVHVGPYTFINDAYNANPASMEEAVQTLAAVKKEQKIAVLGGMLELGDWTVREHELLGKKIAAASITALITLGTPASYIAEAAEKAGMKAVYQVSDHQAGAAVLRDLMEPGAVVLLKGSRGFTMEKILTYFEGM